MPPTSSAIKAVLYPRVSSEKQVREGNGLQTQEHRCRAYAEANGYQVVAVFAEESMSGAVLHRPAMQRLLAFLEAHNGQEIVVVIDDLKRLARDVNLYFALKTAIQSHGARLESPLFRFEDTPEGKFVETVMAAQAELERNQNKRQVLNRMKARLEMGFWPFAAPTGYRWGKHPGHNKVLERNEPRASQIQEALEGFADGRFASPVEVQRFLTRSGYFGVVTNPHNAKYLGQVHRLLRQVLYTGHVEFRPWGVSLRPGHHPALISLVTFEQIEKRLRSGKSAAPVLRADTREAFALRNFVSCARCGRAMTASWSRGRSRRYPYYHCQERRCPEYGRTVARNRLETDFAQVLGGVGVSSEAFDLLRLICTEVWERETGDARSRAAARQKRRAEVEAEVRVAAERLARTTSEVAGRALEARIEELERERLRLAQDMPATTIPCGDVGTAFEQARTLLQNPLLLWQTGGLEMKRTVSRLVFTDRLPYDRKSGFGTARLSLPYLISGRLAAGDFRMVDCPLETWNRLAETLLCWVSLMAQPGQMA